MRPYRTLLEQKIRERRMTLEEFCTYAENFAREHGEPGTLSLRHLQRLAAGKGPKGQPLGPIRPATARLLERIFELDSSELLAPTMQAIAPPNDEAADLRERIQKSRRVDAGFIEALQRQLSALRRLDREFGATATHEAVCAKTLQIGELFRHSLLGDTRKELAVTLSELHALAGWQALDLGLHDKSWKHYEWAKSVALEAEELAYYSHAAAEQAFTLIDIGETAEAVELLEFSGERAQKHWSTDLQAWLSAACGEALAAHGQHRKSLRRFDKADDLLTQRESDHKGPYIVLDRNHLDRWRGHALSRFAHPDAIAQLTQALGNLDPTFARAETSLRVDLGTAFIAAGESDLAATHLRRAEWLARSIGSARQLRRIHSLSRH